jgi:5-methylcytosine-specific restriction endonuclease McrA
MDAATCRQVRERAAHRCEYCRLAQTEAPLASFHVEHITPKQHGGGDALPNLALSCYHCNLHKGPNLSGLDPESGSLVPLFSPRQQVWEDHFERVGDRIEGRTAIGRATVRVLAMNDPTFRELRAEVE